MTVSRPRTRIILGGMSRMAREIIERAIAAQPDMDVIGEWSSPGEVLSAVAATDADVIVAGEDETVRDDLWPVLERHPRTMVLTVTESGRSAFLHELRARRMPLGEVSPAQIVDEIRAARAAAAQRPGLRGQPPAPNPTGLTARPGSSPNPTKPARAAPAPATRTTGGSPMSTAIGPIATALPAGGQLFAPCAIQTPFPPGDPLFAAVLTAEIIDPSGDPDTILPYDVAGWKICVNIKLTGTLVNTFCGFICVCVYADACGEGCVDLNKYLKPETCRLIELDSTKTEYDYCFVFDGVPEGPFLPPPPPPDAPCAPCPYEICIVVTYLTDAKKPGHLLTGNCKGPLIQFFHQP